MPRISSGYGPAHRVNIVKKVKVEGGWNFFPAVVEANGKLKDKVRAGDRSRPIRKAAITCNGVRANLESASLSRRRRTSSIWPGASVWNWKRRKPVFRWRRQAKRLRPVPPSTRLWQPTMLATGVDPMAQRKTEKTAKKIAVENSFQSVTARWLEHWQEGKSPRHVDSVPKSPAIRAVLQFTYSQRHRERWLFLTPQRQRPVAGDPGRKKPLGSCALGE